MNWPLKALVAGSMLSLALVGCGSNGGSDSSSGASSASQESTLPRGSEPANLDPAEFTTKIDNPYWPMAPGSRWVYRETDTTGTRERAVVEVTRQTKTIANG